MLLQMLLLAILSSIIGLLLTLVFITGVI